MYEKKKLLLQILRQLQDNRRLLVQLRKHSHSCQLEQLLSSHLQKISWVWKFRNPCPESRFPADTKIPGSPQDGSPATRKPWHGVGERFGSIPIPIPSAFSVGRLQSSPFLL